MRSAVYLAGILLGSVSLELAAADQASYYQITELVEKRTDSMQSPPFGPFATAVSADGSQVAFASRAFNLDYERDMGLPLTYDFGCYYSSTLCSYKKYGSEYYPYGWSQWREELLNAASVLMDETDKTYLLADGESGSIPGLDTVLFFDEDTGSTEDRITALNDDGTMLVGYGSAPFIDNGAGTYEREFIRRASAQITGNTVSCSLLPDLFDDGTYEDNRGGYSAAYDLSTAIVSDTLAYTQLAVGSASVGLPDGNWDNFNDCQFGDDDDFYYCPGFNTQAWAWDLSACVNGDEEISGFALSDSWEEKDGDNPTYTASALAINSKGIAVGFSTKALSNSTLAGRARAVYFAPDEEGNYQRYSIADLDAGFSNFDDSVRHTWAVDINDNNIVVGNLRYNDIKGRNRPVEFFVYDQINGATEAVSWPLRNNPQSGSNSYAKAINNNNLVIGWRDAQGQTQPVESGTIRTQAGFLYSVDDAKAWYLTDLTCSVVDDMPQHPLYRIEYPRAINEHDEIIATAYKYPTLEDYINSANATGILVKLTPNPDVDINSAPICSALFPKVNDKTYERKGAAIWSLLPFMLMVLWLRRKWYR